MHTALRDFLNRVIGAVAMTLIPVVLTAFLALPSTLHGPAGRRAADPNAPAEHMT